MESTLWEKKARRKVGKIDRIEGSGQFALVAPCGGYTVVSLWETEKEAEDRKESLKGGCGGKCNPALHQIIDLG